VKELIKEKVLETKRNLVLERVSEAHTGLSVGALYKLFPSKERLFFEYIEYQIKKFHEELIAATAGITDPMELLKKFVELKFGAFISKKEAMRHPVIGDPLFFVKMNTQKSEPAAPIYDFLTDVFEKLGEVVPLKESNHRKTAYIFNAYTTGFVEHWLNRGRELDDDVSKVVDMFISGVRKTDG